MELKALPSESHGRDFTAEGPWQRAAPHSCGTRALRARTRPVSAQTPEAAGAAAPPALRLRRRAQVAPPTPPPRAADVAVGDEVSHVRSPSLEQTSAEAELSHSHLVSHEQGG